MTRCKSKSINFPRVNKHTFQTARNARCILFVLSDDYPFKFEIVTNPQPPERKTQNAKKPELLQVRAFLLPCVANEKDPGDDLLSHDLDRSIIDDGGLNFRVRNGIGCTSSSLVTRKYLVIYS